jgi:FAD synthase
MTLGVDLAAIVTGALFRVGQQVVGVVKFLEALRRLGVTRMQVGMVAFGELPVGRFDRRLIRVTLQAKDFIGISHALGS